MKKIEFFSCILLLILVSCHQKQEQKSIDTPKPQEAVVLDGVYHFKLDGFELWTLQDVQRKMSADLFKDAKKADLQQYMPDGEADASINAFLVKIKDKYILFDAGLGLDKGGLMLDKLTLLNLRPEDIAAVCITHCHGDHIGGLVSQGEPVFPNAEIYCADKELKAFKNDALTKEMVKVYGSHLHAFVAGDTLLGEVQSIAAPGHTPGHTFYQIGNLLIVGDLVHAAALQIPHPEYCAKYDADKKTAVKTRKEAYQYIRDNQLVIAGMHLPFSGVIEHFEEQ